MVAWIGIYALWALLYGYMIVAAVDFGSGTFLFYDQKVNHPRVTGKLIRSYLSPYWEGMNVLCVFLVVGIVDLFPVIGYYYGMALLIPGAIAFVLFVIRDTFYSLDYYGRQNNLVFTFIFGVTGLFIPAILSMALIISEGGYIADYGGFNLLIEKLFGSFYTWSVIILTCVSVLYISASFLVYYAGKTRNEKARKLFRRYALFWSVPTLLACVLVFVALENHNFSHFENMVNESWWFLLSLLCFLAAIVLIFWERYDGIAFLFVMLQFFFAFFGYGATHLPYILYPSIEMNHTFTSLWEELLVVAIFILALVIPSAILWTRQYLSIKNTE